jgi:acyl-coenzyme A synthetase/AMP-(fatty) acid ligase
VVLARSGARVLVTVTDFLGTDYVAMLEGRVPHCRQLRTIVVAKGNADRRHGVVADFLGGATPASIGPRSSVAAPPSGPDDPSDILFTSGTTGVPRAS